MLQCYQRGDPNHPGKPSDDRRRGRPSRVSWRESDPRHPVSPMAWVDLNYRPYSLCRSHAAYARTLIMGTVATF